MMYPTGYADQGIDFSKASQNLLNSATQLQVAQAKKRMGELSESEKYILKSADMATIPEVSGSLRNKFDQDIQGLRQKTIDIVRQRNGKLTSADKGEIERQAIEVQNSMSRAKLNLEELAKKQSDLLKPGMDQVINVPAAREELGRLAERLQKGEDVGTDIAALPIKHAIIKSESQLFTDQMKNQIAQVGTKGTMKYDNGKMVTTTATDEADAKAAVQQQLTGNTMWLNQVAQKDEQGNVLYNAGKPVIDQAKLEQKTNEFLPLVTKTNVVEKPIPSRGRGTGSRTNDLMKLTWESGSIGKENYQGLTVLPSPSRITAMMNNADVTNTETLEKEKASGKQDITITHAGIDENGNPRMVFVGKGGIKKKGDEPVYSRDGTALGSLTASEVEKSEDMKSKAKELLPDKKFKIEGDGVFDAKKGVVTYKAVKRTNWLNNDVTDETTVDLPLKPVYDKDAESIKSMKIDKSNIRLVPPAVLNMVTKTPDGREMKMVDYLEERMGASGTKKPTTPSTKKTSILNDKDFHLTPL